MIIEPLTKRSTWECPDWLVISGCFIYSSQLWGSSLYFLYCDISPETDIFIGGELPAVWPPSSAGEREELDQDVGGCDQGWATGAVLTDQWTGKSSTHTPGRYLFSYVQLLQIHRIFLFHFLYSYISPITISIIYYPLSILLSSHHLRYMYLYACGWPVQLSVVL